jgi:uncharacterized iron-regulated membrane protein
MNPLTLRRWHGYIGMFIAPSILFFALTGAMQLFSLHEAHGKYQPPALLEQLGKLHKDQVFESKDNAPDADHEPAPAAKAAAATDADHDAAPGGAGSEEHGHHHEKAPRVKVYVLKWFCLFVALGLATSTAFGIWMGLKHTLHRRIHVILLIVGAAVPIVLIAI